MTNQKFLVINAGSSSLKFTLYKMPNEIEIVNGLVEKIGKKDSCYTLRFNNKKILKEDIITNHADAIKIMMKELLKNHFIEDINEIKGIGHRILHGGEIYSSSVIIDDEVLKNIKSLAKLGPLHHPGEISGIKSMQTLLPNVTQVAVFDTAFHQTIPKENYIYAVPYEWYKQNGVRKYGFHGTSHKYITETMKKYYKKDNVNLIICHIGSGVSISCIKNGSCYDTTMGLTPLDGVIMGTRSGSIDPSIMEYVCKERKLDIGTVTDMLNNQSGLMGISTTNDFRDLEKLAHEGNQRAKLALEIFTKSITKYIAQYYFELKGNIDALVFTAGIGENAIDLRSDIIDLISNVMKIKIDKHMNYNISKNKINQSGKISTKDSSCEVLVIPTNEEYMILKDTIELTKGIQQLDSPKVYRKQI